jgi:hypothetical protein
VEKTFPFLQLPGELRTEVYKHLFAGKAGIFPDVTGSRKFRSCNHHLGTFEKPHPLDVAFLQTCRLVHEEAAPILYSENAFGFTTHVVCNRCIDRQIIEEENAYASDDPEIPDPTPIYQVDCGLQLMYTWLCLIGNRNRACIEKIMIAIDDAAYLYYDGEPKLVDDIHPDWTWSKPAGEFLGKALDLLAKKNSINRLILVLEGKPADKEALSNHFFHNGMESKLFTKLTKINNPGMAFILRPLPEKEEHKKFYMHMRAKMEYQEQIQARRAALKAKLIAEKRQV